MRILVLLLILMARAIAQESGADWPQWRGPNRDGSLVGFREPSAWADRLKQVWKIEVGTGYATPLVIGGRLYLFTRVGEEEVMSALDAASGKQLWRTGYATPFTVMSAAVRHGPGPKSTPAFSNGRLFTVGMTNIVTAFDSATGRMLWQKPATKVQPMYHTAMSPLVDGNNVIVHTGGPGDTALAALDAATGQPRWSWSGDSPAYGSPIVVELGGVRQVVTFTHRNMVGISAADGRLLWQRPFTTPSDTTSQTPIPFRDTIIQAGRGNGYTAFRVVRQDSGSTTQNLWQTNEVSSHMTNSVVVDGVLYGLSHLNSGQYFALDLATGTVLWKSEPRQAENAAIVRAGNIIFSLEDDAELVVFRASRTGLQELRRYTVADSATWAQPTISGDRIFVKDVSTLTSWALR